MSSDKAYGLIYILGPLFPTIAPQNSLLLLFRKKEDFDIITIILLFSYITSVYVGVFSIA